jgi:hypothetical protein
LPDWGLPRPYESNFRIPVIWDDFPVLPYPRNS